MSLWTCPACDRQFGRPRTSHVCIPGCSVDDTFASRPPVQREIYDTLVAHVGTFGRFHADAVSVGVFLKSDRKFAEVRPKARWLSLELVLLRRLADARVSRVIRISADRTVHVVRLVTVVDVDHQVLAWLTEAYDAATD